MENSYFILIKRAVILLAALTVSASALETNHPQKGKRRGAPAASAIIASEESETIIADDEPSQNAITAEQQRRAESFKEYAHETNMVHAPLMFADNKDIDAFYAEDVRRAELTDQLFGGEEEKPLLKRLRKGAGAKAVTTKTEGSPSTSAAAAKPKKTIVKRSRKIVESEESDDEQPQKTFGKSKAKTPSTATRGKRSRAEEPEEAEDVDEDDVDYTEGTAPDDVIIFHNTGDKKGSVSVLHVNDEGDAVEEVKIAAPKRKYARKEKDTSVSDASHKKPAQAHINPTVPKNLEGTYIIYDSETTNLHPKCGGRLCEIAALKVVDGVIAETFHIYLNPDMKSWPEAYKAHGLSEKFLRPQKHFYDVAKYIEEFFGQDTRVAHNGHHFDDPYLNYEMRRAKIFFQFLKMLDPTVDLSERAPKSVQFDPVKIALGNQILRENGIISDNTTGPQINLDQRANLLASAAMIYFFKEHMSQAFMKKDYKTGKIPIGPLMFRDGHILPNPEKNPKNYEAAVSRLAWFKILRAETETPEQRAKLLLPHEKPFREAIELSEKYLLAATQILEGDVITHEEFKADPFNPKNIFDTLVFARNHPDIFKRGFHLDNLKLDGLADHYGINRYARESGTHGAGIDTQILFQVFKKMIGYQDPVNTPLAAVYAQNQEAQEEHFFQKNSILCFDRNGARVGAPLQIHDDGIKSTTHERSGPTRQTVVPSLDHSSSSGYSSYAMSRPAASQAYSGPNPYSPEYVAPAQLPQVQKPAPANANRGTGGIVGFGKWILFGSSQ